MQRHIVLGAAALACISIAVILGGAYAVSAQQSPPADVSASSLPRPDALLNALSPEKLFQQLQNYIRVPLPGTGVRNFQIGDVTKINDLNTQVTEYTGVNVLKFFQFIGSILVAVFGWLIRLIQTFLPQG